MQPLFPNHPDVIVPAHTILRSINTATIRQFVNAKTDEEKRATVDLFTDDCSWGANLPCAVMSADHELNKGGKESVRKFIEWKIKYLPEQVYLKPVVYQTNDPNHYFVLAKHDGYVSFPAYGEKRRYNTNNFMLEFFMEEGKIQKYFEYSNMVHLYSALGVKLGYPIVPPGWPEATEIEKDTDGHQVPRYTNPATPDAIPTDDMDLRQKNIDTLRKYVDVRIPAERALRWDLFDPSGTTGAAGGPVFMGKEKVRACTEWNLVHFADSVFNNNIVFQTQDPNLFMVVSDGDSYMCYPAYGGPKRYINKFWHVFRMYDGVILDYYEYSNVVMLRDLQGIEIPELDIPEGWE